jgi:hypothetical protein
MSWLIAVGVVIILGAVTGVVWRERNRSFGKTGVTGHTALAEVNRTKGFRDGHSSSIVD